MKNINAKTVAKSLKPKKQSGKLGALIDRMYALEQQRAKYSKLETDTKRAINKIGDQLLHKFKHSELEGSLGKFGSATIKKTIVGTIKDWDKFITAVTKKKDWSLLERRISNTAYRERVEAGLAVPGVETFTKVSVKVTKRKGRR